MLQRTQKLGPDSFHQSFGTSVILTKNGSDVWNPKPDESLVLWADFVKRAVSGWWIVGGKVWANHRRSNYQLINVNNVDYFGPGCWSCLQFLLNLTNVFLAVKWQSQIAISYLKLSSNKHIRFQYLHKVASFWRNFGDILLHSISFNCEL